MYDFDNMNMNLKQNQFHLNRILLATYGLNLFEIEFLNNDRNDLRASNIQVII